MRTFVTSMIAASLLTLAMPVQANGFHGHRHHMRHHHYHHHHSHHIHRGWIAPAIVGGVIAGAAIHHYANPPVIYNLPTISYTETTPLLRQTPVCTEWREFRTEDGRIIQERTCIQ